MEHILFEHVDGLELFELKSYQDLNLSSYTDYNSLTQVINYVSTFKFNGPDDVNSFIDSDEFPTPIISFLQISNVSVLHADKSLKNLISNIGITPKESPLIMRGIRANIHRIKKSAIQRQLVLSSAHLFSRNRIKFSIEKGDLPVPIIINEIEQLEEEILKLNKQIECVVNRLVPQYKNIFKNVDINKIVEMIINGKISELVSDDAENSNLVKIVISDSIESFTPIEKSYICNLNDIIMKKKESLEKQLKYLEDKLGMIAPNLQVVLGDRLTAKIIEKANGIVNLSMLPSSTVQLLGAEKSLFRSLKTKGRTPKHGLLYDFEGLRYDRGRMCRYIASKCTLAARIDVFDSNRTNLYGKELKKMIERRINLNKRGLDENRTENVMSAVHNRINKKKK